MKHFAGCMKRSSGGVGENLTMNERQLRCTKTKTMILPPSAPLTFRSSPLKRDSAMLQVKG